MAEHSEGFKKFVAETQQQKPIGQGMEKVVYPHPTKPDRVIGLYHEDEWTKGESSYIKGRYYLTKILHLLFPKNIPDIHRTTTTPITTERTRIETDDLHQRANQGGPTVDRESKDKALEDLQYARNHEEERGFLGDMLKMGIFYDYAAQNYTSDAEGNFVYLDDFIPWSIDKKREYNPDALRIAITERLSESEQERALQYLDRLEQLYQAA